MKKFTFSGSILFCTVLTLAMGFGLGLAAAAQDANVNPLFTEKRSKTTCRT